MLRRTVLLAVLALAVTATPAAAAGCPAGARALIPDMRSQAPSQLTVREERPNGERRFYLTFRTGVENAGAGPLRLHGSRPSKKRKWMSASQIISCSDGTRYARRGIGRMRFVRNPTHVHWHMLGFEHYTLRTLDGDTPRRALKRGFCLGDSFNDSLGNLRGKPSQPVFSAAVNKACGARKPWALTVREGVSVGWGDGYAPLVEGQYVDLTNLAAGTYRLLNEVDRAHATLDQDFENNVSGTEIELTWPDGMGERPQITVGGSCLSRGQCSSREPLATAVGSSFGRPSLPGTIG